MEKEIAVEERIRRAEEIYNRRNGIENKYNNKIKKRPNLIYKILKQIIICFIIYGIFYVVSNREYFLSTEFQANVQNIASQNEYLNSCYNYVAKYLERFFNISIISSEENITQTTESNDENVEITEESTDTNDENIGGAEEDVQESEKSQEEQDVEEIKNTISFIVPVQGTISSTFGWRTPTTATVPKYHTGIDIATETGTVINSATDGTVILASSDGDYGNHYKIQINDITIIYAHCSKLYLTEGDSVTQGQAIAEVGSTGNSTGPHLHFEIRKGERLVNPELILEF